MMGKFQSLSLKTDLKFLHMIEGHGPAAIMYTEVSKVGVVMVMWLGAHNARAQFMAN